MNEDRDLELMFSDSDPGQIDRREFLKLGSGLFVLFTIGDFSALAQQRGGGALPTDFNAFLKIGDDGRVLLYTGKIEMGQGINTSLCQMIAEELDVALESVDIVMGDTDICPWDMGTFGSRTTRFFGPPLRTAGAEARHVLLQMAGEHLKTSAEQLSVENGVVFERSNKNNKVSYAQLTKGKRVERKVTGKVPLKKPSEFKIIGKSVNRRDGKEKVTGAAKYTADLKIPGMMYAKILRPPAHGAKLLDVDLTEANKVDGVQIVRDGDFIAVLHKYPDVAEMALSKIKAKFEPSKSTLDDKNIFDHLLNSGGEPRVAAKEGNLQSGEQGSASVFDHTYFDGYKAHSPIEPHAAIAKIEGGKVTVWASTQTPFPAKEDVAKELGISPENVRIIVPYVGGGFGGKRNRAAVEAVRVAKLSGKPVQVAWNRKEEFFNDSFRPAAVVKIRSGIASNGAVNFWDYRVYFAGERGAAHFYSIPNHSTSAFGGGWGGSVHPFGTGPWRAPGNNTNTFARESQIDIMAAKAGLDPLEFRLNHLKEEKMRGVLKAAGEKFGWKPAKGPSGRGWGIACGMDAGAYVATIVEVGVDKASGEVKVKRMVCAQDMGLVINPEGARIQIEGCLTMGLGYALKEDIRFKNGEILDVNFNTYDIPRFSWVPKIETVFVEDRNADPQGGGEPAIITVGGAIANAVYDAVGARVFQMPITPARVNEAMSKG